MTDHSLVPDMAWFWQLVLAVLADSANEGIASGLLIINSPVDQPRSYNQIPRSASRLVAKIR